MLDLLSLVPKARFQVGVALSPDADQVAYSSNATGRFGLWLAPVNGNEPRCLIDLPDRAVRQIGWAPDGKSLVFTADRHGDEQYQIYRIPAAGGPADKLTTAGDRQHVLAAAPYDPTGRYMIYAANDRDETVQDLIIRDLRDGVEYRHIPEGKAAFQPIAASPDGRWLLIEGSSANIDSDCYLLDLTAPNSAPVRVTDGSAHFEPTCWSADATSFYVLTTAWGEFTTAARYSLGDKSLSPVIAAEWDVETILAAHETLLWTINENGRSVLHTRTGSAESAPPSLPAGVITSIDLSNDGTTAALQLETATRPREIAVLDLTGGVLRYLTDNRPPALASIDPIEPRVVTFAGRDRRPVSGLLYRPRGQGPFPTLMWIHGGPEAQERPAYERSGLYQYLLAHGIAIYAPNAAGSTGYGISYQRLLYRDWGGIDLNDFEAAADYLRSHSWIDPSRLAVAGGSYGGFAALSCLTRLPRLWAAGVSICGPSNLLTLAAACPPTWRTFVNTVLGDPDTDAEHLTQRLPIAYVDRLTAPLLVIQGAHDPRVPKHESDQIIKKLRNHGGDVNYIVYDDERHGFTNRDNEIDAYSKVADFLINQLTVSPRSARNPTLRH